MFDLSSDFSAFAMSAGEALDAIGVVFIFGGAVISTLVGVIAAFKAEDLHRFYRSYRHNLARSIITGLDFLVAGDIIRTVAGELTLEHVLTVALVVIIRIVISLEFELTLYGRWPWARPRGKAVEEL